MLLTVLALARGAAGPWRLGAPAPGGHGPGRGHCGGPSARRLLLPLIARSPGSTGMRQPPAAKRNASGPPRHRTGHPGVGGLVATWLPPATAMTVTNVAFPYAAEATARWQEAAGIWHSLNSPYHAALALARSSDRLSLTRAIETFDALVPVRPRRSPGAPARAHRPDPAARPHHRHPKAPSRAHPARDRGSRPPRRRPHRCRDRATARAVPPHRRTPRGRHPGQTRRHHPAPGWRSTEDGPPGHWKGSVISRRRVRARRSWRALAELPGAGVLELEARTPNYW